MQLKDLRLKNKFSQSEFAEKLGISRQTYINYETGKRSPELETLLKISEICNVSLDYIVGKDDNDNAYDKLEIRALLNLIDDKAVTILGKPLTNDELDLLKSTTEYILKVNEHKKSTHCSK